MATSSWSATVLCGLIPARVPRPRWHLVPPPQWVSHDVQDRAEAAEPGVVTVAASSSKAVVLGSHLGGRGIGHTVDELRAVGTAQGCQGGVGKGGPVSQGPIPHPQSSVLVPEGGGKPQGLRESRGPSRRLSVAPQTLGVPVVGRDAQARDGGRGAVPHRSPPGHLQGSAAERGVPRGPPPAPAAPSPAAPARRGSAGPAGRRGGDAKAERGPRKGSGVSEPGPPPRPAPRSAPGPAAPAPRPGEPRGARHGSAPTIRTAWPGPAPRSCTALPGPARPPSSEPPRWARRGGAERAAAAPAPTGRGGARWDGASRGGPGLCQVPAAPRAGLRDSPRASGAVFEGRRAPRSPAPPRGSQLFGSTRLPEHLPCAGGIRQSRPTPSDRISVPSAAAGPAQPLPGAGEQ